MKNKLSNLLTLLFRLFKKEHEPGESPSFAEFDKVIITFGSNRWGGWKDETFTINFKDFEDWEHIKEFKKELFEGNAKMFRKFHHKLLEDKRASYKKDIDFINASLEDYDSDKDL